MPKLIITNLDASREFSLQDPSGLSGTVLRVGAGSDGSFDMSESLLVAFEPKLRAASDAGMVAYRSENSADTLGDNFRDPVIVIDSEYQSRATDGTVLVMAVPCTVFLPTTEPGSGFNLRVIDGTGRASTDTPITVEAPSGSGALNGGAVVLLDQAYAQLNFERAQGAWYASAQPGASSEGFAPPFGGAPVVMAQTNGSQTVTLFSLAIPDESSVHVDLQVIAASVSKNGAFRVSFGAFRRDAGSGLTVGDLAYLTPPLTDDASVSIDLVPSGPGTITVTVTGSVAAGIMNWSAQPQYRLTTAP